MLYGKFAPSSALLDERASERSKAIAKTAPKKLSQLRKQLDALWEYQQGDETPAQKRFLRRLAKDWYADADAFYGPHVDRVFWAGEAVNELDRIYGSDVVEAVLETEYQAYAHRLGLHPVWADDEWGFDD